MPTWSSSAAAYAPTAAPASASMSPASVRARSVSSRSLPSSRTVLVVGVAVITSGATLLEGIAAYAIVGAVMYYLARRTFV